MATQVKVILTALNGDLSPAERILNLDPDRRAVPIGRASKSLSKGLQGATDNAWFDSPVMSRDHAQISLNTETNALLIQDIGSMHGTILNDVELPRNESREVNDGDVVIFGAEVRRGPETFPACAFRVNYEFSPYKAANTFAFPESSDIEDEEDYGFSDEELDNEQVSSEGGVSIESPPPKVSQAVNAIDLTRDESPVNSSYNSIDLTGDTPAEKRLVDLMSGRLDETGDDADASNAMYGGNALRIEIEDDDEESHHSSECESLSEIPIVDESGSSDGYDLDEVEDSEEEDADADDDDDDDDDDIEGAQEPSTRVQEAAAFDNNASFAEATNEKHPIAVSALRTIDAGENITDNDDDHNDFGLAKAGAEGLRAMMDGGLLQNNPASPYHLSHYRPVYESESSSLVNGAKHVTFAPAINPEMKSRVSQLSSSPITGQHILLNPSSQGPREPSPSDAAMARLPEMNVYHIPADLFRQHTAQTLGEKSGKEDFFNAREHNKAQMQGTEMQHEAFPGSVAPLPNYPLIAEELQSATAPPTRIIKPCIGKRSRFPSGIAKAKFGESSSIPYASASPLETASNFSMFSTNDSRKTSLIGPTAPLAFPSFLDKPDQSPIPYRAPSPLPDMTSAVKYNESKASMAGATNKTTTQPQVVRSGLRIDEIIDRNSIDQSDTSLKRKSDAISNAVEEEVRIWGSTLNSTNPSFAPESPVSAPGSHAQTVVVNDSEAYQAPEQRPTKRLKKLMENVAYAALGGVAVGAALFGGLVATAPDFM